MILDGSAQRFLRSEERVGAHFNSSQLMEVRSRCWESLAEIHANIQIGDTELEATDKAVEILKSSGAETFWHKVNVRFGVSTIKNFKDPMDAKNKLGASDIYYIDIGPVYDGYEADAGCSYTTGSCEELRVLAAAPKEIFELARQAWRESRLSGHSLFEFAEAEASRRKLRLIGRHMSGHRLSDFPHAAYYKGKLADQAYPMSPYAWVLEICVINDQLQRGAFYEDLLYT